jgi:hypothetical protein
VSTQIGVRIPDDLVAFVDYTVKAEGASGCAAIVTRALDRSRGGLQHPAGVIGSMPGGAVR